MNTKFYDDRADWANKKITERSDLLKQIMKLIDDTGLDELSYLAENQSDPVITIDKAVSDVYQLCEEAIGDAQRPRRPNEGYATYGPDGKPCKIPLDNI